MLKRFQGSFPEAVDRVASDLSPTTVSGWWASDLQKVHTGLAKFREKTVVQQNSGVLKAIDECIAVCFPSRRAAKGAGIKISNKRFKAALGEQELPVKKVGRPSKVVSQELVALVCGTQWHIVFGACVMQAFAGTHFV